MDCYNQNKANYYKYYYIYKNTNIYYYIIVKIF